MFLFVHQNLRIDSTSNVFINFITEEHSRHFQKYVNNRETRYIFKPQNGKLIRVFFFKIGTKYKKLSWVNNNCGIGKKWLKWIGKRTIYAKFKCFILHFSCSTFTKSILLCPSACSQYVQFIVSIYKEVFCHFKISNIQVFYFFES